MTGNFHFNRLIFSTIFFILMNVNVTVSLRQMNHYPSLYKCSVEVSDNFLNLPNSLKYRYPSSVADRRLGHFATKFNTTVDLLYNFTLIIKNDHLNCLDGDFSLKIPTDESDKVTSYSLTPDGWLGYYMKNEDTGHTEEIYFHPENFCIASIESNGIMFKACKSQCYMNKELEEGNHPCIPKCCRLGRVMTLDGCYVAMDLPWTPDLYSRQNFMFKKESEIIPNFQYSPLEWWDCDKHESDDYFLPHNNSELHVLTSGKIYTGSEGKEENWIKKYPRPQNTRDFCIDGFGDDTSAVVYDPQVNHHLSWSCNLRFNSTIKIRERESVELATLYLQCVFGITLVASIIYLLIIVIYLILWDKQNYHGYIIFTLTLTQFLFSLIRMIPYGIFGFDQFNQEAAQVFVQTRSLCIGTGICLHFLLLSSFSWTTVLSLDVWLKIGSMKPISTGSKGTKKYLVYSLFGFGFPLVILMISILMEFFIGDPLTDDLLRPGYKINCAISEFWEYVSYIIIITLFLANMIFVILTVKVLWEAKKSVKALKDSATSSNFENNVKLIGKLFVLMGIFLLFEIVFALWNPVDTSIYLTLLDLYRIVNAVGQFYIFLWNKRTFQQLTDKFPSIKKFRNISISRKTTISTTDSSIKNASSAL